MFTSRRRRESKPAVLTTAQVAALLFGAGEQGVLFAFDDFSKLFQDAGGTTPVTAVGQPIGKALDQSGRGNHATFTNAVLSTDGAGHYGLTFNGVSTVGATGSINFTATDKVTVVAGLRKLSDAAVGLVVDLGFGPGGSSNGSFSLTAPASVAANAQFASRGTSNATINHNGLTSPVSLVLTGAGDISAPNVSLRANADAGVSASTTQGTGNYGTYPLNFGMRSGAIPLNAILYALSVRGAASNAAIVAAGEAWANSKTGAY